ncbi:carbohydrate-binding domain-containing protein [Zongyangia hominis]|uniref:Carbohydrate-binding domain-containing protein n=1 Tax=Zongyangia hominis TaxID=2763677 RepID=A0A926I7L0_9FIRM|nr:carbohydrate-binding domain-containing protein [Zongyangia hominis]MBC8571229.1 carbohydrate-binding domain-containing protein [Zongyangia hominis]
MKQIGRPDTPAPILTPDGFDLSIDNTPSSFDPSKAAKIHFDGTKISVQGRGATARGNLLTIGTGGTYVLSGRLDDGCIVVMASEDQVVQLVLDGASIPCKDDAPLYVIEAGKVVLTLTENSENYLSDGSSYALFHGDNKVDGCIYSKVDLVINGTGSLEVTGNFRHGIVSKDGLTVTGGRVRITSAGQGLSGRDYVKVGGGEVDIRSQTDGIQSSSTAKGRGLFYMAGGNLAIDAQNDAIQAENLVQIDGGTLSVTTRGGSENAPSSLSGSPHTQWSMAGAEKPEAEEEAVDFNAKGLKSAHTVRITGGEMEIDTYEDAIHANGSVEISGGNLSIFAGDDAVHADEDVLISGGTLHIPACYEGLEGATVTISGGDIAVTASDDGINAASKDPKKENRPKESLDGEDNDYFVRITGGTLSIDAAGDGIDTNGDLYVEGGSIQVCGASYTSDTALDYDGVAIITGGTILAAGSGPWAQGFGPLSTQYSFLCNLPDTVPGGIPLTLTDQSGQVLATYTPARMYQSVVYSSPALRKGETYFFLAADQSASVTLNRIDAANVTSQETRPTDSPY